MHRAARLLRHLHTSSRLRPQRPLAARAMSGTSAARATQEQSQNAAHPPTGVSSRTFRVACVQMTSQDDMAANLAQCTEQIRRAAAAGCKLIATPENTGRMTAMTQKKETPTTTPATTAAASSSSSTAARPSSPSPSSSVPSEATHPVLIALQQLACELQVYILVGSLAVRGDDPSEKRFANRSYLIGPKPQSNAAAAAGAPSSSLPCGAILGRYTKIHMFDTPSLGASESYLESARVLPGEEAVLVSLPDLAPGASVGMTICYDLRFPHLFRTLAQAGANILTVPSAFTVVTGETHWHALLRARAIETGSYVLAPAQCTPPVTGPTHPGGRQTYGHSLIVSPWGAILADAGQTSPGFVSAEIDLEEVDRVRKRIPSLQHDRPFKLVKMQEEKK